MKTPTRLLWFLVALLAAGNLATGLGVFYLLGRLDRAQSQVFDPDLADLRELAWQSANLQRVSLNLLLVTDPAGRAAVRQRFARVLQANRRSLDRLHQTGLEAVDDTVEQALGQAGEKYLECADRVCSLVDADHRKEAQVLQSTELRACFVTYQSAQASAARCVSDHAVMTSSDLIRSITGVRSLLLAAAGLPLAVLAALGLAFVVFLALLYRIFSRLRSDP